MIWPFRRRAPPEPQPSRVQRARSATSREEVEALWIESIHDESPESLDEFIVLGNILLRWPEPKRDRPGYWYSHERDQWLPTTPSRGAWLTDSGKETLNWMRTSGSKDWSEDA